MDLNKKVSFACDKSQLELPEEYDQNDADYVDCECFWEKVELAMLVRRFPCHTVPEFEVQTQLLLWSPFMGKMTRKNDLLLNTEHRKVDRNSGELEEIAGISLKNACWNFLTTPLLKRFHPSQVHLV